MMICVSCERSNRMELANLWTIIRIFIWRSFLRRYRCFCVALFLPRFLAFVIDIQQRVNTFRRHRVVSVTMGSE